jgi:hypothetical protein
LHSEKHDLHKTSIDDGITIDIKPLIEMPIRQCVEGENQIQI